MHLLCIPIEDAVFEQELVQDHKIVCAFAAFGGLAIEYDDFFEVLLREDLASEFQ